MVVAGRRELRLLDVTRCIDGPSAGRNLRGEDEAFPPYAARHGAVLRMELLEADGLAVRVAQFDDLVGMRDAPQRAVVQRDFQFDEAVVGARRRIEDDVRNGFRHVAFDGGNLHGDLRAEAVDGFEFGAAGRVGDAAELLPLFEEGAFDGAAGDDVVEAVEQHGTPRFREIRRRG